MKNPIILAFMFLLACNPPMDDARHYRTHRDFASLKKAFIALPNQLDTTDLRRILGEPIDFGFDYRYLSDSIGEKGCPVGAVFWITDGKVTDRDIFEICE